MRAFFLGGGLFIMRYFLFLFFLLLNTGALRSAEAYIAYDPNENLKSEVDANPYRILPRSEYYSFAVDADFFKPAFIGNLDSDYYRYDYYHGNGYWMTLRSEFTPSPKLTLDIKTIFTHGSSSNGPTYDAIIYPMVGITYEDDLFGFHWKGRLSDIGRQTIGTGLFIEDKETDGGYLIATKDDFRFKVMVDGTGSFRLEGGVVAFDTDVFNGLIGATVLLQETGTVYDPPPFLASVYSKHEWSNGLGYGIEAAADSAAKAAMVYGTYHDHVLNHVNVYAKPQIRYYGSGILGSLPGQISQNYVSYDQNDKPYTNLMDIFSYGDHVVTYSTQLNVEYVFNIFYRAYAETELVDYDYLNRGFIRELFYRTGLKFNPVKNRPEEIGLLVGNKYLIASTAAGDTRTYSLPNQPDYENKPLFLKQFYFMFDFATHF
jgi:hypothetical protein